MSKPKEADLRDAKEDLIGRLNEMSRQGGVVPDDRKAEAYVNPIIEKVARDEMGGQARPVPVRGAEELSSGQWYGEPEHSPKVPESIAGEKVTLKTKVLGEYQILPGGKDAVRPLNGAPTGNRRVSNRLLATVNGINVTEQMARDLTRELWTIPEWKVRLQSAADCNDAKERQGKMEAIFADAFRLFGAPVKHRNKPRRIIVS